MKVYDVYPQTFQSICQSHECMREECVLVCGNTEDKHTRSRINVITPGRSIQTIAIFWNHSLALAYAHDLSKQGDPA